MEKSTTRLHHLPRAPALLLLLLLAAALASHRSAQGAPATVIYTVELQRPTALVLQSYCNGSIAECAAAASAEEFEMYSEVYRRVLEQGRQHVSGGALESDRAVCSSRGGQSYGGHCPAASGNPPSRGCSYYDRCRVTGKQEDVD